jgi:hypothetical protein
MESAVSGFGVTGMHPVRSNTLPPQASLGEPFAAASGRKLNAVKSEHSEDGSFQTEDLSSYASGGMTRLNSGAVSLGQSTPSSNVSPMPSRALSGQFGTRPSRALGGNFGRVAAPLRSAASMQASALLTATVLPERGAHSADAARQPSLLALAPSGALFPAPAGSMPYDILPSAISLEQGLDHHIQLAANQHSGAAIRLLPSTKLETLAESYEDEDEPSFKGSKSATSGTEPPTKQNSMVLHAAGSVAIQERDALAKFTGDFSDYWDLAPVTNSPFVTVDIQTQQGKKEEESSQRADSTAAPAKKIFFVGGSPFEQELQPADSIIPNQAIIKLNSEDFVDAEEPFQESVYLNDSLIMQEQAVLDVDLFSPFAAAAQTGQFSGSVGKSGFYEMSGSFGHNKTANATAVQRRRSGVNDTIGMERAHSAAQVRAHTATQKILDIAATLSAGASAALRTNSVYVLPVMPASVYDHSLASTPSFDASPKAPKDFTYLIVSVVLVLGLVACSIAEVYLR